MLARDRGNNYDVQYIKKLYNFKQAFFIEEKLIFTFFFLCQESSHVVWDKIARVEVVDLRSKRWKESLVQHIVY